MFEHQPPTRQVQSRIISDASTGSDAAVGVDGYHHVPPRGEPPSMLSLVQAIARQTAARGPEDFIGHFTERIQALAANQDLLVRNEWQGVDVEDLAACRTQVSVFVRADNSITRGDDRRIHGGCP